MSKLESTIAWFSLSMLHTTKRCNGYLLKAKSQCQGIYQFNMVKGYDQSIVGYERTLQLTNYVVIAHVLLLLLHKPFYYHQHISYISHGKASSWKKGSSLAFIAN